MRCRSSDWRTVSWSRLALGEVFLNRSSAWSSLRTLVVFGFATRSMARILQCSSSSAVIFSQSRSSRFAVASAVLVSNFRRAESGSIASSMLTTL